jgi:hypothetical protein
VAADAQCAVLCKPKEHRTGSGAPRVRGVDQCSTSGCANSSRWPRPRRRLGFCNDCLARFAGRHSATMLALADDPRGRFRVRHEPCDSVTDVSLPMLRNGWVCQMCKLNGMPASRWGGRNAIWSLDRQEQLLVVAGFTPLIPLVDNVPADSAVNVQCNECGGAQTDSLFGLSEGVRLSWLPCTFCNQARFKPTHERIRTRFAELGLTLVSEWTGDPKVTLEASCSRCGSERRVSWSTIASAPPCLRCDGRRLDPEAPHRVYLFKFPRIGAHGVFKVGITHCVDDRRLTQHVAAGGELVQVVDVADRATAFAIETTVLERFQILGPVTVSISDLPQGGASECWDAFVGHPDLADLIPAR